MNPENFRNHKIFNENYEIENLDNFLEEYYSENTKIKYVSKIKFIQNDNDNFILRNKFLYNNADHWSTYGERHFSKKIRQIKLRD